MPVAIFIKSSIQYKIVKKSAHDCSMEFIFIELSAASSKMLIGTVYRPNKTVNIAQLIDFLHDISVQYDNIVIAGDFNSNIL